MHLEFYLRRVGWPIEQVTEQSMFDCIGGQHGKILLVENEAEAELMDALQLIYGSELLIDIKDPDTTLERYLQLFSWVFTSWDPRDRNRI